MNNFFGKRLVLLLLLMLVVFSVTPPIYSNAEILDGDRDLISGDIAFIFDNSVGIYEGYFTNAHDEWEGITSYFDEFVEYSVINKNVDRYFINDIDPYNPTILGFTMGLFENNMGLMVPAASIGKWECAQVVIYWDSFLDLDDPNFYRQKTVTHEIGHTLKLDETMQTLFLTPSVMRQGTWMNYNTVQSFDENELIRKWGN